MSKIKKTILSLITALLCVSPLLASGPIGHVYFAQRYLEENPLLNEEYRAAFMVGTLFPDIQLLDEALHDKTHFYPVTLQDVADEISPFHAGILFHCYVDWVRADFMKEYGIFDHISDINVARKGTFMKAIEDELLFDKCYLPEVIDMFDAILPEEREWESNESILQEWHDLVCGALSDTPAHWIDTLRHNEKGFLKYSQEDLESWHGAFPEATENPVINDYMQKLCERIESSFAS